MGVYGVGDQWGVWLADCKGMQIQGESLGCLQQCKLCCAVTACSTRVILLYSEIQNTMRFSWVMANWHIKGQSSAACNSLCVVAKTDHLQYKRQRHNEVWLADSQLADQWEVLCFAAAPVLLPYNSLQHTTVMQQASAGQLLATKIKGVGRICLQQFNSCPTSLSIVTAA